MCYLVVGDMESTFWKQVQGRWVQTVLSQTEQWKIWTHRSDCKFHSVPFGQFR